LTFDLFDPLTLVLTFNLHK